MILQTYVDEDNFDDVNDDDDVDDGDDIDDNDQMRPDVQLLWPERRRQLQADIHEGSLVQNLRR